MHNGLDTYNCSSLEKGTITYRITLLQVYQKGRDTKTFVCMSGLISISNKGCF